MTTIKEITLLAVGDVSLTSQDGEDPFRHVLPLLRQKDVLFGNLEAVLTNAEVHRQKAVVLRASPDKAKYLAHAGFDILNLANNHSLDFGVQELESTARLLDSLAIEVVGVKTGAQDHLFTVVSRKGVRIGFLSLVSGVIGVPDGTRMYPWRKKEILGRINVHRRKCELLVVSLHWGVENATHPSPNQIDIAHSIIDAGASIILGHGPHVIQAVEKYGRGCIAYSLGNFNFDNRLSQTSSNWSMVVKFIARTDGSVDFSIVPIVVESDAAPIKADDDTAEDVHRFVSESAAMIAGGGVKSGWWYAQVAPNYLSSSMTSYTKRLKSKTWGTIPEIIVWLISPFTLRCLMSVLASKNRRRNLKP